jgi:DNA-binding NarL/FixJ family response regulator
MFRLKGLDPDVKAVMVRSLSEKEKVVECAKAGASHYILKPYDEEKVVTVLEKISPPESYSTFRPTVQNAWRIKSRLSRHDYSTTTS